MRLFIFESHPVQYHAPVYRELESICQRSGSGELRVYYASDVSLRGHFDPGFGGRVTWDEPLLAGYQAVVLQNERGTPLEGFRSLGGRGIASLLRRERPGAVLLTGLRYEFDWAVYLSALCLRIPIWLRTETQDEAFERPRWKDSVRSLCYAAIYSQVDTALVIGRLNARHYERHGLPSDRHVFSPYCVVDRFTGLTPKARLQMRERIRKDLGFSQGQTVFLFCGKLQPKKNPGIILEALEKLPVKERARYGVVFVGSGELDRELRLRAGAIAGLRVRFPGFKNQTDLPAYYLAGDVLILPSRKMGETWGLVVNEALLAGCRVIASAHVGCMADFRDFPGVHVFDGSIEGLIGSIRAAAPEGIRKNELGGKIHDYSVEAAARGLAVAMGTSASFESAELCEGVASGRARA